MSGRSLKPVAFREEKTVNAVRAGDVLSGRYRLEEKVGEGGMGAVFVANDTELDRKVAVKLLAAGLVNDAEVMERFEREARLTAKLDHPNIIPIYDVGRHEGRPFIVMKLLQGDSLAGRLRAKGGFTTDETLRLVRQLAAGLDYIHAQGFIHRDIKAGNIFVAPDGHATILDFGILRSKEATTGITRTGMVMGTPHYMAPEQALGLKDVDHRVDLYALAVVLFECLTGTLPFEADSELRLIQLQAHAPPPELVDRAPWIPKVVADVVKRALAKNPSERYGTAAELVTALEAAYAEAKASKSSLPAVQVTGPVPTTAPSLRRQQISRTNLQVVNAALPTTTPSTNELAEVVRPKRAPMILGVLAVVLLMVGGVWYATREPVVEPTPLPTPPLVAEVDDAGEEDVVDAGEVEVVVDDGVDAGVFIAELEDAGVSVDAGAALVETTPIKKQPATKKKGRVNVITTRGGEPYWAQVSIDGVAKGRTPLLLDLAPGRYAVRIERSGFKSVTRDVRVVAGKPVVVKLELTP